MQIKPVGLDKPLTFPDDWQQVETMPEDPPDSIVIMKVTEESQCMALIYPIDQTMPLDNPQAVIDGKHNSLDDDQGLVEVENVPSKNCIYSIVKTKMEPVGVQYCLTFHFALSDNSYNVTSFFSEQGTTGKRDTVVYELARRDGIVKSGLDGWAFDPYDNNFTRGFLMNLSENCQFDEMVPLHPLSETRRFIKELVKQL
jgi:hypothetical protein